MSGEARVSVVVTHYEQPAQLARVLAALRDQSFPAHLVEIVVADDGSREPPVVPPGVVLVRQDDHGFRAAAARNLGARHSSGELLVFLDADTTPEPDFLARVLRLPSARPEAVVVGRRRHVDHATGVELAEPAWLHEAYRRTRHLDDADETSFRFVISAVLACTSWFFDVVGGFDETFTAYGGEDWEWAHRAWTHGAHLSHEPLAVAWHDGPEDGVRRLERDDAAEAGRQLDETLAIARRIPVAGVAPAGLLLGPADPLVTLGRQLSPDAVVLTADSVLAAMPRARLLLSDHQVRLLGTDPRVLPLGAGPARDHPAAARAWRRLHVHVGVSGTPGAWTSGGDLLRGPHAPGLVSVVAAGTTVLTWQSLRAERRAARWSRDDLDTAVAIDSTMDPIGPDVTVASRWGGWR